MVLKQVETQGETVLEVEIPRASGRLTFSSM